MEYVQALSCLTSCVVDPVKQIIWYSHNVEAMRIKAGIINGKLQPYDALKQRWEGFKFSDPAEASIQRAKDWCQKVNQILDYESIKCTCNPKRRYNIFHQIARLMGSYDDILSDLETYNEEVKKVKLERKESSYFIAKSPLDKQLIKYKQQDLVISEELIVGVKKELGWIIEVLMDSEKSKWVGIWGMGGIGKTTLAKLVHNNVKIRQHFQDAILWITVGMEPSQDHITKELRSIVNQEILGEDPEFGYMKKNIVDVLRKQRCLLILDDIWTFESLEKLDLVREHDSKILVTTRKPSLLKRVHAQSYRSRLLSQEESRGLFFKHVFGSGEPGPINTLQGEMVEKMADACGGLPLALEVTGKAMAVYSNDGTMEDWKRCFRSFQEEGDFLDFDDEGALEMLFKRLKFSYDELATIKTKSGNVVQECFLYVAAFPEDHEIFVDDLIKCWRGEDLVGPDSYEEGMVILKYLESRALVQIGRSDEPNESISIHDMIHKLCTQILEGSLADQMEHEKRCDFNLQSTLSSGQILDRKYLRKASSRSRSITRLPSTMRVTQVLLFDGNKSFASLDDEAIEQLKEVKVLSLQDTSIQVLPESISKLIHLRTLDLKETHVTHVPSSIFSMHTLRHLDLGSHQCYIEDFPFEEIYKLSQLEHLAVCFHTHTEGTIFDCSGLTHLSNLRHLDIRCRNLESVMKLPCLSRLLKLEKLVLDGHMDFTDTGIIINSGSQSQLQNLKYCHIEGALIGWKWPGILEGSHNLTTLRVVESFHSEYQEVQTTAVNLQWLDKCTHLIRLDILLKGGADFFSLPSLPLLKMLEVRHSESLQPVAAQAHTASFPQIEEFRIYSREQLRDDFFTSLKDVQLTRDKYMTLKAEEKWHHIPNSTLNIDSLRSLVVYGDIKVVITEDLDLSSSRLKTLFIGDNSVLVHLPRSIANLPQLKYLSFIGCTNLKSITQEDVESPDHLFPSLVVIGFGDGTPQDVHIPAWLKDRIDVYFD